MRLPDGLETALQSQRAEDLCCLKERIFMEARGRGEKAA
jgi:hypothetical protein